MKFITCNLWDSPAGMPARLTHICRELAVCQADVLCLQEVPDSAVLSEIAGSCGCPYIQFHPDSGTAVLTKLPQENARTHEYMSAVTVADAGYRIRAVSLHLPWQSALLREKAITEITAAIESDDADYTILAGDFNGSETSSVHRFLTGDCSLMNRDAYYFDLALAWAALTGEKPENTLDFQHNPRWGTYEPANTIEIPQRFDRIYLKNPYPAPMPVLADCRVFGKTVYPETGLAASDHYGVYAELIWNHIQKGRTP